MQKTRVTINLEPTYVSGLKVLARRENRTVSDYLRLRIKALVDADPSIFSAAMHDRTMHNGSGQHAGAPR